MISRRLLAGLLLVFHGVPGLSHGRQLDAGKFDRASDASVSSTRTYRNETIGFTYPLPDGFSLNEDAAKQSQLRPGTGTLFVADQVVSGRPCINRVVVMADDMRRYHPPLSNLDSAAKLTAELMKNPNVALTRGVRLATLAGRPAYRADFMKKLACGFIFESLFVIKRRGFEVYWMLGAFTQEERDHLLESLQAVSFQK